MLSLWQAGSRDPHRLHSAVPRDDAIDRFPEQGVRQLDAMRLRVVDELRAVTVHDGLGEPGEDRLFVADREEEQAHGIGELSQKPETGTQLEALSSKPSAREPTSTPGWLCETAPSSGRLASVFSRKRDRINAKPSPARASARTP